MANFCCRGVRGTERVGVGVVEGVGVGDEFRGATGGRGLNTT